MKRTLIGNMIVSGLSLAVTAFLYAGPHGPGGPGGPGGWHHGENPLEEITATLKLTDEQKAKVQPILDSAKPQMRAIHEEAMQKATALMDSTTAQIRPLLTAEQVQKLDTLKKAHENMINAMRELHDASK
jgi:Spy/CpxP family protein refolding chaperone